MQIIDLLLLADALVVIVSIPLILGRVRPNRIYGFRTPRTLPNIGVWYAANRYAGQVLVISAIASASAFWLLPGPMVDGDAGIALFAATLLVGVAASLLHLRSLR